MKYVGNIGQILVATVIVAVVFSMTSVMAATITSPSYKIDGNMGGSFGGQTSSTSYSMTTIGGESIVGNGSSGSYLIDQQNTPTAPSMQLNVQPSGLVGFYPLDENAGTTAADASQYQHTGTFNTTATWDTNGKLGGAVDINGPAGSSNGSVNIADHANLPAGAQMTFQGWVNVEDPVAVKTLASQWATGSTSWSIWVNNGRIQVFVADQLADTLNDYAMTTANNLFSQTGTWRHVAVVYDGNQIQADRVKIYVDGARLATSIGGSLPVSLQNSSAQFSIGAQSGVSSIFPGSIDHVKLFNRALGAAEVNAEYIAQNAGISTGLTLGALNNGSTTSVVDAIVRTNVQGYSLAIQQDHDLQSGVNTIPAVSGSIATPIGWSDGITKGLGFTLMGAPSLDGKWNSGASYAAVPSSVTSFYTGTGHAYDVVDVINLRLRLDTASSQAIGGYVNNITYTGTMIP